MTQIIEYLKNQDKPQTLNQLLLGLSKTKDEITPELNVLIYAGDVMELIQDQRSAEQQAAHAPYSEVRYYSLSMRMVNDLFRLTPCEEFVARFLRLYWDEDCGDVDGGSVQDMVVKCGLAIERPITAEDLKEDSRPVEYGCEIGDTWIFATEETTALLNRLRKLGGVPKPV